MKTKHEHCIMQHGKVILSSPDKVSIPMIWNNITGENFKGKDITGKIQTEADHHNYLEMMKMTAGLPAGYIQLYLKPGVMEAEYLVPSSTDLDVVKKEVVNQSRSIMFGSATKYSDVFTDDTRKNLTERAKDIASSFCDSTYYFNLVDHDGFTYVHISANRIIASRIFAVIETSSIPLGEEAKNEPKAESLTAKKVLGMCKITNENIVKLPDIKLDKKIYDEVNLIINNNGGKWKGGKIQGFQFGFDPNELFYKLQSGEDVNNKKDFQFFATQESEINLMITKANLKKTDIVLEPSAGQGAIVERILPLVQKVELCELMPENRQILEKKGFDVLWGDFLALNTEYKYDKILANPPFTKNQDIDHVLKMYEHLKPKGRLVSIMSAAWVTGTQKKQEEFKNWLREIGGSYEIINEGAFKKSGTNVKTTMVTIDKK